MIVVADTSVLLNVAFLGWHHLLLDLFGEVLVPDAVHDEFTRMAASSGRFAGLTWPLGCRVCSVTAVHQSLAADIRLDLGEVEALSLAMEYQASAVLLDETNARAAAIRLGLTPIGTVGILLSAKQRGLIVEVAGPLRELIVKGRFRLSGDLVNQALRQAGELS